jgi:hypothetical protein
MAGPAEEGAKVAVSVVDAMKSQPMTLALIIINLIFLGAVGWGTMKAREGFLDTIKVLIEKQDRTAQLLYNCTPSGNKTRTPGSLPFDLLSNPYIDPNPKQ